MPVQACERDGKPGFRYGESGACYIYTPGNKRSLVQARLKAEMQGVAIRYSQERAGKSVG